jgi:hypothetical protein
MGTGATPEQQEVLSMSEPESINSMIETGVPDDRSTSNGGQSTAAATATTAKEQATELGGAVTGQAQALAGQTAQQARLTADEARTQARRLAGQTKNELLGQVDGRASQAAVGLQSMAGQLRAIADGRPGEAGPLVDYAQQAADRVGTIAERLRSGGAQGVVDDVTSLARRRPGLFLAGAIGAGFIAGRLVRSGKAAMDEQSATSDNELVTRTPYTGFDAPVAPTAFDVPPMPTTGLSSVPSTAPVELP